jgi:hypothetical protein
MPKGPKGRKRPADVIGNAVHVMRIAAGEIQESPQTTTERTKQQSNLATRVVWLGRSGYQPENDEKSPRRLRPPAGRRRPSSSVRPKGGVMQDEWTKVISGDRLVKFTYLDLPEGESFLTAQIAGHDVVYSVILRQAEHPFNREGVERHFAVACPAISN